MRLFIASLLVLLGTLVQPVLAGDTQPVVVELYTSQGCSSCPPADKILTGISKHDNVIALALHVDYWDYLGWRDDFASADFSNRQRAYARAAKKRTIYTPQMVIQGVSLAVGNRHKDVIGLLKHHHGRDIKVGLDLVRNGDDLSITATSLNGSVGRVVIQIVRYLPEETVKIRGGENSGKDVLYTNIVTDWRVVAQWNGHGEIRTMTKIVGSQPVVVLVQTQNHGPIVAAKVLN